MTTLREFVEAASERAEKLFAENGKISPSYHVVIDGDEITIPAPPFSKEIATSLMRLMLETLNVKRYVFLDEAWVVILQKDFKSYEEAQAYSRALPPPLAHPERKECVMFSAEDETEGFYIARRFIERDADGKGTLGPLSTEQPTISGGRMFGLLPPKGTKQ